MKIDLAAAGFLLQLLMFLSVICGGYGAFVRLQEGQKFNRERFEASQATVRELMERELKAIRERIDDHVHADREDFAALSLAMKADQAAAANLHDTTRENRLRLEVIEEWKREVTRRNGPQPPNLGV